MIETFALVIMMHGWVQTGGAGALGNAIDHIPGFTTQDKCNKAGDAIRNASVNPQIVRTVCIKSPEPVPDPPDPVYVLVTMLSGWDVGAGSRGNAIDFVPGYSSQKECSEVGEQIRQASANKDVTKIVCVEQ